MSCNLKKSILVIATILLLISSNALADLEDSLVAHYKFDGNASDSSGNGNNATIYGNVQLTEDRFGNANSAYLFNGIDGSIKAPHSSSLDITGPITISCWVKAQNTYWRCGLIRKADAYEPIAGYSLNAVDDKANLGMNYLTGGWYSGGGMYSDALVVNNSWHLVTGTYDGTEMRIYIDGQLDRSITYSGGLGSNTADLHIGYYHYPYHDGREGRNNVTLNGAIDDVRIYNRALSSSEIQQLAGGGGQTGMVNVAASANGGVASAGSIGTWPAGYTRYPYYAIDGDNGTTWANQWTIPTWFQVQFDQDYLIEKLAVSWSHADYISSIYLSQDGSNWTEVVPSRRSTANANDTFIIQPTLARYAKVEFTGSYAPSNWIFQAEIREFEAYTAGSGGGVVKEAQLLFRSTNSITGKFIPGFDHVGLYPGNGELVWESHKGYNDNDEYWDPDVKKAVIVNERNGVQQEHSRGSFEHDAQVGESTPVNDFDSVEIDETLAQNMAEKMQSQLGKGYVKFLEWPSIIFIESSRQKGVGGTYSCVGLTEWAAEETGHMLGNGFVPPWIEKDYCLTPSVQLWCIKDPAVWVTEVLVGNFDPVDFIITDPIGRKLGHANGITYDEIPEAFFFVL